MARKVGQIIARGDRRWLIRVYLGRDLEGAKITLNDYLDRWLNTAVGAAVGTANQCGLSRQAFQINTRRCWRAAHQAL
jgi:hypothetical protein